MKRMIMTILLLGAAAFAEGQDLLQLRQAQAPKHGVVAGRGATGRRRA